MTNVKKPRKVRALRLLGYDVLPIKTDIKYTITKFPIRWYEGLVEKYRLIKDREKVTLPYSSLNSALESLPLSIISTGNLTDYGFKMNKPWIISLKELNKEVLIKVVRSWCSVEFLTDKNLDEELREDIVKLIKSFDEKEIEVENEILDLSNFNTQVNGTSNPQEYSYQVLGSYMASEIAKNRIDICIENSIFYFIQSKNTLISYPVLDYKGDKYSISITFELKTIPNYGYPIITIQTSIKRWANGRYTNTLSWKDKTSVYVKYNDILGNEIEGYSFGIDKISRDRNNECYKWHDNVKRILEDATLAYLPELQCVLDNSDSYVGINDKYTLLITYNNENKFKFNHRIKNGISLDEQYQVYKQIERYFGFLKPINNYNYKPIKRTYRGSKINTNLKNLNSFIRELSGRQDELVLEILYINAQTPTLIIECFLKELENYSVSESTDEVIISLETLKLRIKKIFIPGLADEMEKYEDKIKEVKAYLENALEKRIAIVEIYGKDQYKERKDPKFAIRKALYQSNRLNQFVDSYNLPNLNEIAEDKRDKAEIKIKETLRNVFLELFRQLGVMTDEIRITGLKGIPENLSIVGFNLISNNKSLKKDAVNIPIATSIDTNSNNIYVKTPYANDWIEYTEAIIRYGGMNYKEENLLKKNYDKDEINRFFVSILNDIKNEDSLLIIDTSNKLNSMIPDFQDKNINPQNMYNEYKKIRIIRVRNNENIPVAFGVNKEDKGYFTSALNMVVNNVYYSLEGKGTTYLSIYDTHRKLLSPSKQFKSSQPTEIVPVKLNQGDDVGSFVYFVHKLRNLNISYGGLTAVPVVNHLAKTFDEVFAVKDN